MDKQTMRMALLQLDIKVDAMIQILDQAAWGIKTRPDWFHNEISGLGYTPSPKDSELSLQDERSEYSFDLACRMKGGVEYGPKVYRPRIWQQRVAVQLQNGAVLGDDIPLVWVFHKRGGGRRVYDKEAIALSAYLESRGFGQDQVVAAAMWWFEQPAWLKGEGRPKEAISKICLYLFKEVDWKKMRRLVEDQLRKNASRHQLLCTAQYLGVNFARL